ncbi:AAA family ATPase [Pseudoxanthomonas japonensis]|uniref:ATPase AAA-type core domain-containing protein n=1 Tax=Pseudoxanthomonas japonensis TaxID=69284 RepID=A0ABQ6ZDR8_9GAMM|nr:ATP-binding protein [Pseudoxanthomonas japonensis]KAF1723445.1 hypothetical protein CSC78_16195 [Pseudoxanthomonas japonensis]
MVPNSSIDEQLSVDGLGGLRDAVFPLSRFNLIIGPQASGKSLAAKLIYFCKSYPKEVFSGVFDELSKERFNARLRDKFQDYFRSAIESGGFHVSYALGDETIEISCAKPKKSGRPKLEINASGYFEREYTSLRRVYGKQAKRLADNEVSEDLDIGFKLQSRYYERIHKQFAGRWGVQQVFIPAGRSYFSFLQGNIFSLLSNNIPLDPFVKEFGSTYERYKSMYLRINNSSGERVNPLSEPVEQILKGKFERVRGEDLVVTPDDRRVPVANSSSGQQEVLPLLVMLQYLYHYPSALGRSVFIEEPEAHLFPDTQKRLVELLVLAASRGRRAQVVLTTHSPYICAALNNLILAGQTMASNPKIARNSLRKITLNGAYLNMDEMSVLAIRDGVPRSVIDKKNKLIDSRYLDSISEVMFEQREQLLDLVERINGSKE